MGTSKNPIYRGLHSATRCFFAKRSRFGRQNCVLKPVFFGILALLRYSGRTFPVASEQLPQAHHVVDQIHHANLHLRTQQAYGAHEVPAHLRLRTKHVFNPCAYFGFRSVRRLLFVRQRMVARAFLANPAGDVGLR